MALVDVFGVQRFEAVIGHPLGVRDGLAGPLGVGEACDDGLAIDDQSTVGGVDHVRQPGDGLDEFDGVAQRPVHVEQTFPLANGDRGGDRCGRVHPRVDRVLDGEVRRRGHGVVAESGSTGSLRRCGDVKFRGFRHRMRGDI